MPLNRSSKISWEQIFRGLKYAATAPTFAEGMELDEDMLGDPFQSEMRCSVKASSTCPLLHVFLILCELEDLDRKMRGSSVHLQAS